MKSLFTQFKNVMLTRGLEYFGRYYSAYAGSCYDNEDPEGLGRIRVLCPQIYEEDSPDIWAWPRGLPAGKGHGLFWVPSPGDPVYVTFEGGDPAHPMYEPGWWTRGAVPAAARTKKPTTYLLQTPQGHQLVLDDAAGTIHLRNKAGMRVDLTPEGIEIAAASGRTLGAILEDTHEEISKLTVGTPLGNSSPPLNAPAFLALAKELGSFLK